MFSMHCRFIKILAFSLCLLFIFCSCSHCQSETAVNETLSLAESNEHSIYTVTTEQALPQATRPETTRKLSAENKLNSKNAIFCCVDTDEVLFRKKADEKIAPASLTKLLTACVALKYVPADTEFTVGTELQLVKPRSSLCLIKSGHSLTLENLLVGLLTASGNDAAYTVAVNVARIVSNGELSDKEAISYFCNLMNLLATQLGMKNSNFTNPDGWDDDSQYTTVDDLLVLSKYALTVKTIKRIVSYRKKYVVFSSGQNITWKNTNKLLDAESDHYNKFAVGMKTGTTQNAGNCLIASFSKNNRTYIGIVCGCNTSDIRYKEMNYLFKKYAV